MDIITIFSERLKELMIEQGFTTVESLSKQLAVSDETVRLWRNGRRYISLSQLIKLADYLNCSIDYLVGRSDTRLDFTPKSCPFFF